jgi:hypothetical protein
LLIQEQLQFKDRLTVRKFHAFTEERRTPSSIIVSSYGIIGSCQGATLSLAAVSSYGNIGRCLFAAVYAVASRYHADGELSCHQPLKAASLSLAVVNSCAVIGCCQRDSLS